MNDLASFSEWTLALLPRLFLYPGGLWLLALIVGLRFIITGRQAISPNTLLLTFSRVDLTSVATAWAAVALLPLPGANSLTFPTDRFALVGLLAISLAFDINSRHKDELRLNRKDAKGAENAKDLGVTNSGALWALRIEIAVLTAVILPVAGQRTLLDTNAGVSGWVSLLAVLLGLAALSSQAANSLSLGVRLVGWLGLAASPLWALTRLDDPLRVLVAYTALVVAVGLAGRIAGARIKAAWSMGVVWSLAALSLLAALLGFA